MSFNPEVILDSERREPFNPFCFRPPRRASNLGESSSTASVESNRPGTVFKVSEGEGTGRTSNGNQSRNDTCAGTHPEGESGVERNTGGQEEIPSTKVNGLKGDKEEKAGGQKPKPVPDHNAHFWSVESLRSLQIFWEREKDVIEKQTGIVTIDLANREAAITGVRRQIERDVLVKPTHYNNMSVKQMLFQQGTLRREKSELMSESFKAKERFKKEVTPRTADFGIELVKKMKELSVEAMTRKNRLEVELAKIDGEIHQKQMATWTHFLRDIAAGKRHALRETEKRKTSGA